MSHVHHEYYRYGDMTQPSPVPSKSWLANWIWTSDALTQRNQFVLLRKAFELDGAADEATCAITAERAYQLWVNGEWVGEGPAIGFVTEKSCDTYGVAALLKPGKNAIAVVVQFDGDVDIGDGAHTRWQGPATRGGMLCQLDGNSGGRYFCISTDNTWAARRAHSWHNHTAFLNDLYYQEVCRIGCDPIGWQLPDFDDSDWPRAIVLGDSEGNGVDGNPLPWRKLVRRDFPVLTRQEILPVSVQAGEVVERVGHGDWPQEGDQPYPDLGLRMSLETVLPVDKTSVQIGESYVLTNSDPFEPVDAFDGLRDATLILDFGHLHNARLVIEVDGPEGACLDIGYAPNLLDGRLTPYRPTRTSWTDRVVLSPGEHKWRSFFWRQFRYVQITLRNAQTPVRLFKVAAEAVNQTYGFTSEFHCSDPELVSFWGVSQRTAELGTLDRLMDNASRECRNYVVDPGPLVALHGDSPFFYWYLRQISLAQLPNGLLMDSCPGKSSYTQITSCLGFRHIIHTWDHYARFGRESLLREHWETVQKHLSFWGKLVNERGLLTVETAREHIGPTFQFWIDDARIDLRGESLPMNALYLANLRIGSWVAHILGYVSEADDYLQRAIGIGGKLSSEFWDDDRGLFVDAIIDGVQSPMSSEHSQGLMLYCGLASNEQAERLTNVWRDSPQELAEADVTFQKYVLEGLVDYGYMSLAVNLLRRLRRHARPGQETFGEMWGLNAHGGSGDPWRTAESRAVAQGCAAAWANGFLMEHIAGIRPRFGTDRAVRIAVEPVIDSAHAEWCGIRLRWEKQPEAWHLSASFPESTSVEFALPFPDEDVRSLTINGMQYPVQANTRLESVNDLEVRAVLKNGSS